MSGIIGSRFNIRGSGLVGSLGTDGQVFTSSGAGIGAIFEAAAGGGKLLQIVYDTDETERTTSSTTYAYVSGMPTVDITPAATSSKILILANCTAVETNAADCFFTVFRDSTDIGSTTGGGLTHVQHTGSRMPAGVMSALDSPSSTSTLTYQIRMKQPGGNPVYFNNGTTSLTSIMAIEIGA